MSITFRIFIIVLAFILGIYYCIAEEPAEDKEGFETTVLSTDKNCPNLLIQKDNKIYLSNTNREEVPGVNPIVFDNLEEYVEFTKWQRSQGITCPVLFLQKTHDTQGTITYKARPDILDPQGGLPPKTENTIDPNVNQQNMGRNVFMDLDGVNATPYFKNGGGEVTGENALNTGPQQTKLIDAGRNDLPYNDNSLPSYDQSSFYQGTITPMDDMLKEQRQLDESPSAMDSNWGGKDYTNSLIEEGAYEGRKRKPAGFAPNLEN